MQQYRKNTAIQAISPDGETIVFRTMIECWRHFWVNPARVYEAINWQGRVVNGWTIKKIDSDWEPPEYNNVQAKINLKRKQQGIDKAINIENTKKLKRKYDFSSDGFGNTEMFIIEDGVKIPYEIDRTPWSNSVRKAYKR